MVPSERRQEAAPEHARLEGDVRAPDTEQVADVAVEIVRLDDHVRGQLTLHADVVAECWGVSKLSSTAVEEAARE